jgi:hypothetical protein
LPVEPAKGIGRQPAAMYGEHQGSVAVHANAPSLAAQYGARQDLLRDLHGLQTVPERR